MESIINILGVEYKVLDVLYLPLHRFLPRKENLASEYYWAYKLALNASRIFSIKSVVGGAECTKEYYEIGLKSLGLDYRRTIINESRFYLGLLLEGITNRARIIHHVMPFGFGGGQNLYFLFFGNASLVLGPLLTPMNADEAESELKELWLYKSTPRHILFSPSGVKLSQVLSQLSDRTVFLADYLIFATEEARSAWLRRYPNLTGKPYKIIHNGGISELEFPNRIRSFNGSLKIGVASALVKRKRVDRLIMALSKLKNYNFKLIVAGDGPEKGRLVDIARKSGVGERVVFLGNLRREELAKFYYELDIYVALDPNGPTLEKASLQEASMSGVPFISGQRLKWGEVRSVEGGLEVNSDDVEAIADAISYFFEKPMILREKSEEVRGLALREFSDEIVLKRLTEIYNYLGVPKRTQII